MPGPGETWTIEAASQPLRWQIVQSSGVELGNLSGKIKIVELKN
jgi:hypothetical protein